MNPKLRALPAELWRSCPIPLVLTGLALTRINVVLGILFSGHGGIGWMLLLLAFPWVVIRALYLAFSGPPDMRAERRRMAIYALLMYVAVAVVSCGILIALLSPPLKLSMRETLPWFFFPLLLLVQN